MPHNLRALHVVIAEDDPRILELIRTRLELANYITHTAKDGLEAMELIDKVRPRAILLDINMPRLDGFGVLERLRADPQLREIPVLVLTARNSGDDVKRAIALGARDFLAKPFDHLKLMQRLQRLIRRRQPNGDLLLID